MKNCRTLADGFLKNGYTLVSGMPPIHRFKLISTHTFHRGYRQPSLVGGPQAPGKPIPSYFTLNTPAAGYWWRPCWGTPRGLQHNCEQEYRPWWYQTACTWWTSNWHPCAHYPRFKGEKPHCTLYLGCKRWLIALFLRYRKRISLSWPISFIEAYSWPWSTMLRVWFSVVLGLL